LQTCNYAATPIPKLSNQLVVWELKQPLLSCLPELSSKHAAAYDKLSALESNNDCDDSINDAYPSFKDSNHGPLLEEAKQFCIHNILMCTKGDLTLNPVVFLKVMIPSHA
jgi:hypothetical protein